MGDPKRQHKQFNRPRQLFSKTRIEEEKAIRIIRGHKAKA